LAAADAAAFSFFYLKKLESRKDISIMVNECPKSSDLIINGVSGRVNITANKTIDFIYLFVVSG